MVIYLKSGQTIDMGDVTTAIDLCGCEYKSMKYGKDGDNCISLITDEDTLTFYNTDNEILELKCSEIVGIREDVK